MPDEAVKPEESQVPEESEFDAAFAEFAAGSEPDPVDPDKPLDDDEAKDSEAKAKEGEGAADDGKTGDDKTPADKIDPDDKTPDRYAGMSDEDKAYFKDLEEKAAKTAELQHHIDSNAGRITAYQRKVSTLEEDIQAIREGGTAGQPSVNQIAEAMKGTDEEWTKFSEDYPQIANVLDRRMEKMGAGIKEAVDNTLAPVVDSQERIITNEATTAAEKRVAAVAEVYPTWTQDADTPEFKLWLDDQPPGVTALSASDDINDAIALLDRYDAHLVANGKPSLKPVPGPGDDKEAEDTTAGAEQSELEKKRAKQLESAVTPESKSAQVKADAPATDEFETAFNAFAKRKERARA